MSSIFISHSQHDKETIDIFLNSFKGTQVNPILMEYEKFTIPPWKIIQNKIQNSSALFVLLGPNLKKSDYTQNWVIYEVGIADTLNKPIWVFEDVNNEILFPIPHVNNYLIYDSNLPESLVYLQKVIHSYAVNPVGTIGGLIVASALTTNPLGLLLGGIIGSRLGIPQKPKGTTITCCYNDCQVTFEFYNNNSEFKCPSCRRSLRWNHPF